MIECEETGAQIAPGTKVFAVGRRKDERHRFPLSEQVIKKIPRKVRNPIKVEVYQTGGVNIYEAEIHGENGTSEVIAHQFLFSIPLEEVEKLLPKTSKRFNFPATKTRERVINDWGSR
ncbi:MAG TPA: hypothetical protein VFT82_03825 [Candidatus Paceibacterota bacterium]|nr:hypothetical protein [Candidatus Paceibacterota bacterium]